MSLKLAQSVDLHNLLADIATTFVPGGVVLLLLVVVFVVVVVV